MDAGGQVYVFGSGSVGQFSGQARVEKSFHGQERLQRLWRRRITAGRSEVREEAAGLLLLAVHHVNPIHAGCRIGQFPAGGVDHIRPAARLGGRGRRGILQNHHLFGAGGQQKAGHKGGNPMAHIFSSDSEGTRLEPHEQRRSVPYNGPFAFQTS